MILEPENPRYKLAYEELLAEFKTIQKSSKSTREFLERGADFIFSKYPYNPDLLRAWALQEDARSKYFLASRKADDFFGNLEKTGNESVDLQKKGQRLKLQALMAMRRNKEASAALEKEAWSQYMAMPQVIDRLNNSKAVCADFAAIGQYLFNASGVNVQYQLLEAKSFLHANLFSSINGTDYIIDPTFKGLVMDRADYIALYEILRTETIPLVSGFPRNFFQWR